VAQAWLQPVGTVEGRWQWRVPICPLVLVDMDHAPDLRDADVESNRKFRRLSPDEYHRLRASLLEAAAPFDARTGAA
jgi:hypothetical protein